ncbi:MAG: HTH domain-containing protein [Thermoplasmatota archaeon]
MPVQMDSDSLEAKIIKILMEGRPITIKELAKELNVSDRKLKRAVKGLASKNIIQIEELPDKKYLRLIRGDIQFQGTNPSQEKAVKHKKEKEKDDERGSKKSRRMMYR